MMWPSLAWTDCRAVDCNKQNKYFKFNKYNLCSKIYVQGKTSKVDRAKHKHCIRSECTVAIKAHLDEA